MTVVETGVRIFVMLMPIKILVYTYIIRRIEGVSAARQKGLELASGAYIIHVDADDWVAPSYLEVLYEEAVRTNADITICDAVDRKSVV